MCNKFLLVCSVLLLLVLSLASSSTYAQKNDPPSQQFGVGIYEASPSGLNAPSGISGAYALNRNLQIGSYLAFGVVSGSGVTTGTVFEAAPFIRYQFDGAVSPFVQGGLGIIAPFVGSTVGGMFLGGGLAYYFDHTLAIHADVDLVIIGFNTSAILFGWDQSRLGIMWFL
jgi:hypothetical protein